MRITSPFPQPRNQSGVKLPSLLKQRWLLIPVILVVIAGIFFWWLPSRLAPAAAPTTATVSQGTLTITVSGSGTVAAARQVDLSFQQAGQVTSVDVNVGDQVKAGQPLAQLDATDLKLQLQQAQANLQTAQAKLDQAKAGNATPQDLTNAQAAVQSATAQLEKTRSGDTTKADIQSAQAQVDAAQAKLDALTNPAPSDISAAQLKLNQAQANFQTTRDGDSAAKTNAYQAMQQAVDNLTKAQSDYSTAQQNWQYVQDTGADPTNPTTTNAQGKKVKNKLNDVQRQQFYDAYVQAQTALNSAQSQVTQAQVAYDAAQQKEAADVPQAQAAVDDAQTQLDALLHPSADDVRQAQASVTQAQANLTKLKQGGTPADIAQAQAQVTQAQAQLDKLTAPSAESDIEIAAAGVTQAQAQVDAAQRSLDQATLVAPFDGVVGAVNVQPGSIAGGGGSGSSSSSGSGSSSSSGSGAVTLVDRSSLHVDINLSETDAAKVQLGQPITLTFDALPNVTLNGEVAAIAPAATVAQNVVTYLVQVQFDPGTTPIKVGMSATANIQIQQVNDAILVPSRAVQTSGTTKTVTVLQGAHQIPLAVQVETGPTSNGETQITGCAATGGSQCLRPGDVVVVPTTTSTTTTRGQNNGFGGFGGFGGGGRGPGAGR